MAIIKSVGCDIFSLRDILTSLIIYVVIEIQERISCFYLYFYVFLCFISSCCTSGLNSGLQFIEKMKKNGFNFDSDINQYMVTEFFTGIIPVLVFSLFKD